MRRNYLILLALILISATCARIEPLELIHANDLDNWEIFLPDSIESSDVFRVTDNILYIGGIPNGYIRTKESYSSYRLHVEWRWLKEPKNSGVLLHVTGDNKLWPNSIEAQLKSGQAGDLVLIGEGQSITVQDTTWITEPEGKRIIVIPKENASSESTAGEWNSYDITVKTDYIDLVVNGIHQNKGLSPTKTSGNIAIQSEGGPMEFRNIKLTPLD